MGMVKKRTNREIAYIRLEVVISSLAAIIVATVAHKEEYIYQDPRERNGVENLSKGYIRILCCLNHHAEKE